MNQITDVSSFMEWLARESRSLAQLSSLSGKDRFSELWAIAVDALDLLQSTSSDNKEQVLSAIKQCLETGTAADITIPTDEQEAHYFVTLLRFILTPPQIL